MKCQKIEAALNSKWLKIKRACSRQFTFSQSVLTTLDFNRYVFPFQNVCTFFQLIFIECLLCVRYYSIKKGAIKNLFQAVCGHPLSSHWDSSLGENKFKGHLK